MTLWSGRALCFRNLTVPGFPWSLCLFADWIFILGWSHSAHKTVWITTCHLKTKQKIGFYFTYTVITLVIKELNSQCYFIFCVHFHLMDLSLNPSWETDPESCLNTQNTIMMSLLGAVLLSISDLYFKITSDTDVLLT